MAIVMPSAATRMIVALMSRRRREAVIGLSPCLPRVLDRGAQALDVVGLHVDVGHPQQCRDGLFRRAGEVCPDDVRENVIARLLGVLRRIVDVAGAVFLVSDEVLLTEDAKD